MKPIAELSSFRQWDLKKCLGTGGFGEVHLWKNVNTNEKIATKRLKENNRLSVDEICKLKQRWQQEHDWMSNLETPYIVRGLELNDPEFVAYLNKQNAWPSLPVIIMEYCNAGDLRAHLQKAENANGLTEFEVREVMSALCQAIKYLHNVCRIEHRDLKPDNIVIHQEGRKRCYKLTDFGFARNSTDNTILKSVVGTRHYFAVEVVDTAQYTNTVDYWSAAVIAFELICGVLPFIPHQEMYQIIVNIKKKPYDCIAITEHLNDRDQFHFETDLFNETRVSDIFKKKMVNWLRMALDVNYKTRGSIRVKEKTELRFYSDLDNIMRTRVLTVFCLNTCQTIHFEVTTENQDMLLLNSQFIDYLENVTGISRKQFYLVFPTGHPSTLAHNTTLKDVFVESWQDTTDTENPPVMLYLVGYDIKHKAKEPIISNTIKKNINLSDANNMPMWLLEQFERHTHFLLSQEQQNVDILLNGLKEYALQVEHEVFEFDKEVDVLLEEIFVMHGREKQLSLTIHSMRDVLKSKITDEGFFFDWSEKVQVIGTDIFNLNLNVGQRVRKRYQSALRRIKEEAGSKVYSEKNDYFNLCTYREGLRLSPQRHNIKSRLEYSQLAVYNFLQKRNEILFNVCFKKFQDIGEVHKEFVKIKDIVRSSRTFLLKIQANLDDETTKFHQSLVQKLSDNSTIKNIYPIDSSNPDYTQNVIKLNPSLQSLDHSLSEIMSCSTEAIIKEAETHMKKLGFETDANVNEIPTTVHFNAMV